MDVGGGALHRVCNGSSLALIQALYQFRGCLGVEAKPNNLYDQITYNSHNVISDYILGMICLRLTCHWIMWDSEVYHQMYFQRSKSLMICYVFTPSDICPTHTPHTYLVTHIVHTIQINWNCVYCNRPGHPLTGKKEPKHL